MKSAYTREFCGFIATTHVSLTNNHSSLTGSNREWAERSEIMSGSPHKTSLRRKFRRKVAELCHLYVFQCCDIGSPCIFKSWREQSFCLFKILWEFASRSRFSIFTERLHKFIYASLQTSDLLCPAVCLKFVSLVLQTSSFFDHENSSSFMHCDVHIHFACDHGNLFRSLLSSNLNIPCQTVACAASGRNDLVSLSLKSSTFQAELVSTLSPNSYKAANLLDTLTSYLFSASSKFIFYFIFLCCRDGMGAPRYVKEDA